MSLATATTRVFDRARPALDGARSGLAAAADRVLAVGQAFPATERLAVRLSGRRAQSASRRTTVRPATPWLGALGWWVLGVGLLAWWAGRRFGWAEMTVLAVVAGALVVGASGFAIGRSRYEVTLDLARRRVVVGDVAVGRIAVTNASSRALLPAEIELPVGAGLAGFPLPRLAAGQTHEDVFTIPTHRRAVVVVGPVRSVRGDPFGIARREVRWTEPMDLFVHPRTVPLVGASAGFLKDLEGRPTRILSPSDLSFHALRDYAPGDDRRHVHWKSTARASSLVGRLQLVVRQFEETRRSHLAVALSTNRDDYDDSEEFELAVSAAGSLGLHAIREERDLTVLVPGGSLNGSSATRLLDDLTRVVLGAHRQDVVALAGALGDDAPDASVAVLLFGARVMPAQMRAAAVRLPSEVRGIAIQCVPGAALARRAIGALTVFTLGDLADLPKAFRTVGDS